MTGWLSSAACAGADPDLFFPERGESAARAVNVYCAGCPVRAECLAYVLGLEGGYRSRFGVWGGLTPLQRKRLQSRRRPAAGVAR